MSVQDQLRIDALERELAAMTALADNLMRGMEVCTAERDALLAENKWHKASEPPDNRRDVFCSVSGCCFIGYHNGDRWDDPDITHWRDIPQPQKEGV